MTEDASQPQHAEARGEASTNMPANEVQLQHAEDMCEACVETAEHAGTRCNAGMDNAEHVVELRLEASDAGDDCDVASVRGVPAKSRRPQGKTR